MRRIFGLTSALFGHFCIDFGYLQADLGHFWTKFISRVCVKWSVGLELFQVCIKYNSQQLKWKIEDQEEVQSGALNLFNEHLSLLTMT